MTTQQQVIKKLMASLDTTTKKPAQALDAAVKACSNFSGVQAVFNQMISDRKKAANAEDFLQRYCGIFLDNLDTGAITGADAGGGVTKTGTSVVPNGIFDTNFNGTSFTTRGVTFQLAYLDDEGYRCPLYDFNYLTDSEKHVWQGLKSFWAEESLKLIEKSYGYSLTDSDSQYRNIRVYFINDPNRTTATTYPQIFGTDEKRIYMDINMHYFNSDYVNPNNLDGKCSYWGGTYYLDRLIAHEFTHAVMNAKVNDFSKLPKIIKEGLAELTSGIDDEQYNNIKTAVSSEEMLKKLLVLKEDYNEVDGVNNPDYVGGYIFLRYLAKQASTRGKKLYTSTAKQSLTGGEYEDTLAASADKVTIRGNASNDSLSNNGGSNVKLFGSDGADQIFSYGNKVTLDGGKDDDYFYLYSDASNAVVKGGAGNDEIHSAAKKAAIDAGTGNDYIRLFTKATKTTVEAGTGNDTIYSGAQTASISGGDGKDFIYLYSKATKTTVNGGAGNDSIVSYSTSGVVYEYQSGNGKDTITGITDKDTLRLSGKNFSSKTSGKNILLTVDSQNIKLVKGKGVAYKVSVAGTSGNDTVNNSIAGASINLLNGDNRVFNRGKKVSIVTGAGNDSVDNRGDNVTVLGGSGLDTLRNDTANGGANKVKLDGGAGNDDLKNFGNKVTLLGGAGQDTLYNYKNGGGGENVSVDGGANNDLIVNFGIKSTLSGGSGDDSIGNYANGYINGKLVFDDGGQNVKIYGGAGNDSIENTADNVSIFGGAGNDSIHGGNGKDTLWGDAGNDKLWGGGGLDTFIFTANEGTDRIFDYESGDMIKILNADGSNGNFKSSKYSGGDLNITINGGGKIIFDNVSATTNFNINGTSYKISGSKLK